MTEELQVGDRVLFRTPDGKQMVGYIKSIKGDKVEIDDGTISYPTPYDRR